MTVIFYPHEDELETSSVEEKLEMLLESAQRFKAVVLDAASKTAQVNSNGEKKRIAPRDITHSYNWEEIARVLREIRELPEGSPTAKIAKAAKLTKLAEIYEVLRAAKMAKLEAVRIALTNEANQLRGGNTAQVA